jgi:diguanylate cyclase
MGFFRERFEGLDGSHLLLRLALMSAVLVVALGLALAQQLRSMVTRAVLDDAARAASLTADIGIRGYLAPSRGAAPFDRAGLAALDRTVGDLRARGVADGFRFDSPLSRFTAGAVPPYPEAAADRARALAGGHAARRVSGDYVITVPFVLPGQQRPFGTIALALPAKKVDGTIAGDARRLYLILIGGLVGLWLVLLPVLARAARLLRRQAAENALLASTDALTGLPNRAAFGVELERMAALGPIGAMVVDADGFRRVNDEYGQHVGDVVLQTLGTRLRAAVRVGDIVGRLGGDEFGVILDTDDPATLEAVAARVVELASAPIEAHGRLLRVPVSVGVAAAVPAGDVERLLREADDAMLRAKDAGGGRAELGLAHAA